MSALATIKALKEHAIERIGAESTPLGGEFAAEMAAELRDAERKLQQHQRDEALFREDTLEAAFALRALYYEDCADPMLLLMRMGQVAGVMADPANYETLPKIQPCRKCGRELGSRLCGPQDHDTCPTDTCHVVRCTTCRHPVETTDTWGWPKVERDMHCQACKDRLGVCHICGSYEGHVTASALICSAGCGL